MRSAVSFLIGCVLGATGVLVYLHETKQLAIAAEHGGPASAVRGAGRAGPASGVTRSPAPVSADHPNILTRSGLLIPVLGVRPTDLRRDFGDNRSGGRTHGALDIRAPTGTPVIAVADGTIRKLFTSKAGGLTIYQYDNAEERCYYYAHLDRYAGSLKEGQRVAAGDIIGYVGVTGNAPPGAPHLHFAITILPPTKEWWKGEVIDPYPLLTGNP